MQLNTQKSEKLAENSNTKHDEGKSSQSARLADEKHSVQQQIQDYKQAAAKQKRAVEKKWKEIDKMEANDPMMKQSVEEKKKDDEDREEMVQKERALSRDIRQMSTQNWEVKIICC